MACHLAEFYRDEGFHEVFTERPHWGSTRWSRALWPRNRELEEIELKKSSSGELTCFFFCFQIMEERAEGSSMSVLYKLLGCQRPCDRAKCKRKYTGRAN